MIIFRVDGNTEVGLGHVMRCLSIADAFLNAGEDSLFITAGGELNKTIESRGYRCIVLSSQFNHLEGEINHFIKEINKTENARAVIIDSYYVTYNYLRILFDVCEKKQITLVYIDDVLAFPYPCKILLNYNIYANEEDYLKLYTGYKLPFFLLNTSFQPIRFEFQDLPDRVIKKEGRDILISTGGSDTEHIGEEIIKTIVSHNDWNKYFFHYIVGVMSDDVDIIDKLAVGKDNIILHKQVRHMADLMRMCDVAITAAGSTMYELCATQTPSLTYVLADNQIPGANGFEQKDVLKSVGDIRVLGPKKLAFNALTEALALANNYEKRVEMALRMKTIVDGKGACRIAEKILWLHNHV